MRTKSPLAGRLKEGGSFKKNFFLMRRFFICKKEKSIDKKAPIT